MPTVKVKYNPSGAAECDTLFYYQISHDHQTCRVNGADRSRVRQDLEIFGRIIRHYESIGVGFTARDIAHSYRRYIKDYTLFKYMQSVIHRLQCDGRMRCAEIYSSALRSFVKYRGCRDILLDSLTTHEIESYAAWLKGRGVTPNTVSFYMRTLRALYNRAVGEGAVENRHPFSHVYTGVEKTSKRALPLDVIRHIRHLDLKPKLNLEFARDLFMLSFYLRGMSFVDMCFLKKCDLADGYVIYRRRKTGQRLVIKWTREMQEIIDKYPAPSGDYLLPIIKETDDDARRAYLRASYTINRNLKKVGVLAGVAIPLTLYVARHSWASAARNSNVPLSVISEGMGHDSEKTTLIYLASLNSSAVDDANSRIIGLLE